MDTWLSLYNLCSCINVAQHFPMCCSVNSVCGCCGVKRCPQLFLSIPRYIDWHTGLLDFSELHSSSLRTAPRTVGFFLQTMLRHSLWLTKAKKRQSHAIPCCNPINRLLSQLKHKAIKSVIRNFTLF